MKKSILSILLIALLCGVAGAHIVMMDSGVWYGPDLLSGKGNMEDWDVTKPDTWTLVTGCAADQVADPRTGSPGSYATKATRDTSNAFVIYKTFVTVPGQKYRAMGWLKKGDATYIQLTKIDWPYADPESSAVVSSTSWAYRSFDFVADTALTAIVVNVTGSNGQYGYADDVTVVSVN